MQTPIGLPPELRLNFDYVFLLKENSAINRKKLWMNYASVFPSLDIFEKVFAKITENFCSMVINNKSISDKIEDQIFWFKAKERKFTFGCKAFKAFHNKYYDKHHAIKNKEALLRGAKTFGRKKNELELRIEKI